MELSSLLVFSLFSVFLVSFILLSLPFHSPTPPCVTLHKTCSNASMPALT